MIDEADLRQRILEVYVEAEDCGDCACSSAEAKDRCVCGFHKGRLHELEDMLNGQKAGPTTYPESET